jgi:hypothetical protein
LASTLYLQQLLAQRADDFVMQAGVADPRSRRTPLASLDLASRHAVESTQEPWGLNVTYGFLPSGVLRLRATTLLSKSGHRRGCA